MMAAQHYEWVYLIQLNCMLKKDYDGKFYVICI